MPSEPTPRQGQQAMPTARPDRPTDRRGGLAVLPWAITAVSIVLPALLTRSLHRDTIVAIPLA